MDAVRGVDASVEHERAWRASMQRGGFAKVLAKSERLPRTSIWYVRRELHADTSYSQGLPKAAFGTKGPNAQQCPSGKVELQSTRCEHVDRLTTVAAPSAAPLHQSSLR